jgi:TetR/AcrR family transcriptional regulator
MVSMLTWPDQMVKWAMANREETVPKPGNDAGKSKIIAAARTAFAERGYDGARLRAISEQAGVLHTTMLYHFKSKDVLWRAVVDDLFAKLDARMALHVGPNVGNSARDRYRLLVGDFIRFSAQYPELHRIMTSEGRADSERLRWLVDRHTRRLYELTAEFADIFGLPPNLVSPARLYFAVIGLATAPFTLAPEFQLLSGADPFSDAEVEQSIEFVETLLFREQ